jgi:hypothetical protein
MLMPQESGSSSTMRTSLLNFNHTGAVDA